MVNLLTKIKNAFKKENLEVQQLDITEIKPIENNKCYTPKVYIINVEKYQEGDPKVFYTIKAVYNYGDKCLIYEKDVKEPVAFFQYKLNGWERI